ncbi:hypothetical protein B0H10DRAFT_2310686 [Mycena sp. CBHHK59/15]|nr:hypothetical protein B0H10DRAFT_2310686 [Mycena sp. CBHHK59/15]
MPNHAQGASLCIDFHHVYAATLSSIKLCQNLPLKANLLTGASRRVVAVEDQSYSLLPLLLIPLPVAQLACSMHNIVCTGHSFPSGFSDAGIVTGFFIPERSAEAKAMHLLLIIAALHATLTITFQASEHGNTDATQHLHALLQAAPQALSRIEHDAITENKLVCKCMQVKQRSDAMFEATPQQQQQPPAGAVVPSPARSPTRPDGCAVMNSCARARSRMRDTTGRAAWALQHLTTARGMAAPLPTNGVPNRGCMLLIVEHPRDNSLPPVQCPPPVHDNTLPPTQQRLRKRARRACCQRAREHATAGAGAGVVHTVQRWAVPRECSTCSGWARGARCAHAACELSNSITTNPSQIAYRLIQILPNRGCTIGFGRKPNFSICVIWAKPNFVGCVKSDQIVIDSRKRRRQSFFLDDKGCIWTVGKALRYDVIYHLSPIHLLWPETELILQFLYRPIASALTNNIFAQIIDLPCLRGRSEVSLGYRSLLTGGPAALNDDPAHLTALSINGATIPVGEDAVHWPKTVGERTTHGRLANRRWSGGHDLVNGFNHGIVTWAY